MTTPTRLRSRWWVWLLSSPLACCLVGSLIMGYARLTLDSNPVYVGALKRANANPAARARMGSPIEVTGVQSFRLGLKGTSLLLEIAGPKGRGLLLAVADGAEPDSLEIFKMKIRLDSGEIISLDGGRSSADDF